MVGKPLAVTLCLLVLSAYSLPGQIKLLVRDGRPFVDGVYVNSHGPYRFLLDTGTNMNLMETGLAHKIGMGTTLHDVVESAVGKTLLAGSDDNIVELRPVRAGGQRFQYSDLETVHLSWPDMHGVLGQAFLSCFDYRLDLRGKRLDFGKQETGGNRAPFRIQDGRTAVSTSLGDLVLDSGAPRLVLFGVLPVSGELREMLTVTGSQSVHMIASRLMIAGRDIWRGDAVALPNQAERGVAGLMPLSIFKAVYVCNSERYVVFE